MSATNSSELSQLLSSLGVSTSAFDADSTSQGPDPLVINRNRLTRLRADVQYGSQVLKDLSDLATVDGSSPQILLRLTPPITSKAYAGSAPPFTAVQACDNDEELGAYVEKTTRGEDGVTYTLCEDKAEAILLARGIVLALIDHFESLRTKLVADARSRIDETVTRAKQAGVIGQGTASDAQTDTLMDEDGRVLNEQGLPFVDPVDVVHETTTTNNPPRSSLAKFQPEKRLTGNDRKRWIDDVFSRFEGREDQDDDDDNDDDNHSDQSDTDEEAKMLNKERDSLISELQNISKAKSPKPLKSALKQTSHPPPPTPPPKFGSSGIRRGFLNMNPSSPAAEASSSPISTPKLERSLSNDPMMSSPTPSHNDEKAVERLTQSAELPPKKHVRIQDPHSDSHVTQVPTSSRSRDVHPDDIGVEEEAARIVQLLGPQVVQGTPAGDEALNEMKRVQAEEEKAHKQAQEAIRTREEKARKSRSQARPPVGMSVTERTNKAVQQSEAKNGPSPLQAQIQQAKASAFKKGFLNSRASPQGSKTLSPPTNADPRTSLGMSALDRSLINDKPIEEHRQAQGLPPAVPHARPSKAYAEKMEKRKRGEAEEQPASSSKKSQAVVGTESDEPGNSKVRFQLAASDVRAADDDDDERDSGSEQEAPRPEGELELDEHDEEEYARAAYASGDISDNEDGPSISRQRTQKAKAKDNAIAIDDAEDDMDDSGWDLDSDSDGYDSSDLADLEPTFDGLVSDLENAELAREYALAKARQMEIRSKTTHEQRRDIERAISGEQDRSQSSNLWTEEEIDRNHLNSISGGRREREPDGGPPNKMSRFRASRIVKALGLGDGSVGQVPARPEAGFREGTEEEQQADAAGHELAHLLEGAANIGPDGGHQHAHAHPHASQGYSYAMKEGIDEPNQTPVMVLPSLTPLRYPRTGDSSSSAQQPQPLTESTPIPRDGIDLEGETDEDEEDDRLMDVMRARLAEEERQEEEEGEEVVPQPPPRAPHTKREEGDGGMGRHSGTAMQAPPQVIGSASAMRGAETQQKPASRFKTDRQKQQQQEEEAKQPSPPPPPPAKVSRFKASRMAKGAE